MNRKKIEEAKERSKLEFFQEEEVINKKELENMKITNTYNTELAAKVAKEKEKMNNLPPIRGQNTIEFQFSARPLPTPKRESKKEEEEQWAKKQKEALEQVAKKNGNPGDIGPEMTPQELLQKAQNFFNLEDYESALEVYSYGIDQVCPNYPSVWNNRAAVHLKIGNFHQAIKDATKALELLDPPCESNAVMRVKALMRRGMAQT